MPGQRFEIEASDTHTWWAELSGGSVVIHQTSHSPPGVDRVLVQWDLGVLRDLLAWGSREGPVASYLEGPMAHQVRQHSQELGMTPEMFVWHAVKIFIDAGTAT